MEYYVLSLQKIVPSSVDDGDINGGVVGSINVGGVGVVGGGGVVDGGGVVGSGGVVGG